MGGSSGRSGGRQPGRRCDVGTEPPGMILEIPGGALLLWPKRRQPDGRATGGRLLLITAGKAGAADALKPTPMVGFVADFCAAQFFGAGHGSQGRRSLSDIPTYRSRSAIVHVTPGRKLAELDATEGDRYVPQLSRTQIHRGRGEAGRTALGAGIWTSTQSILAARSLHS